MEALLLTHAAATLVMFGVILIVQVVHYPLFSKVGEDGFAAYQTAHMRQITYIVFPTMTIELLTALALVFWQPAMMPTWQVWLGLALVGVIWLSTAFLQVPLHDALRTGFDAAAHRRLVRTNWLRTLTWAARSVLVLAMLAPLLRVK